MKNVMDMMMEEIFNQFETASQELEAENNKDFKPTLDEFLSIELDSKWFNRLVEDGLIELN